MEANESIHPQGKINWDRPKLERLKLAYLTCPEGEFEFDGFQFYGPYAKYLIEYLESVLKDGESAPPLPHLLQPKVISRETPETAKADRSAKSAVSPTPRSLTEIVNRAAEIGEGLEGSSCARDPEIESFLHFELPKLRAVRLAAIAVVENKSDLSKLLNAVNDLEAMLQEE